MWPFKNKAREAVERRLDWYPTLTEIPSAEMDMLNFSCKGVPIFYDENGRLWPAPSNAYDPYAWHSIAEMIDGR